MNAVIYARYSSDKQKEQSIEGQLRYCYEYAKRQGLKVVGEYIDRAMTGKFDNRPEFQRMITASSKKQFQVIIVWKFDRFARNRYDSAIYKHKLKKNGVKVISATEAIGEGSESIIVEAMFEAMAEVYSVQLGENAARGMRETALKGEWTGGNIPLGYKVENKKLVIDNDTAHIVKFIFEQYALGKSKTTIVNMCEEKGYRTKSGKPFYINTLTNLLKNKIYVGDYTFKGEIKRTCPAIVDEETFNKCQKRIEENKIVRGKKIVDNVEYLLSGKLYCGHCGTKMTGDSATSRDGTKHYYYTCHNRKKYHQCKKKREKKDFIEWYVCEQTIEYVLTDERIEYIASRVVEEYNKDSTSDVILELESRLARIDIEMNELVDKMLKTKSQTMIDKINERAELLELQKADAADELAKLKLCCNAQITIPEVIAWLKGFCKGDLMDMEFRRRIIDVLVNCVYLYDDKVVIYYNVRDGQQTSYIEILDETADLFPGCEDSECSDSSQLGEPVKTPLLLRVGVYFLYSYILFKKIK